MREISVDSMSYKNASAKQTHDYRDGLSHLTHVSTLRLHWLRFGGAVT
jgi:hypothetical protein